MYHLTITKITPDQEEALEAFWKASQRRDERGHEVCLFCGGGNNCRCGQCDEWEWHRTGCPALLVYELAEGFLLKDLELRLTWEWEDKPREEGVAVV